MKSDSKIRNEKLSQTLIKQIELLNNAERAGDKKAVAQYLSDEYYYKSLGGNVIKRREFLNKVRKDNSGEFNEFADPAIVSSYDGDYELNYIQTLREPSGKQTRRKMDAYLREDGQIKIVWQKEIARLK